MQQRRLFTPDIIHVYYVETERRSMSCCLYIFQCLVVSIYFNVLLSLYISMSCCLYIFQCLVFIYFNVVLSMWKYCLGTQSSLYRPLYTSHFSLVCLSDWSKLWFIVIIRINRYKWWAEEVYFKIHNIASFWSDRLAHIVQVIIAETTRIPIWCKLLMIMGYIFTIHDSIMSCVEDHDFVNCC